MFFGLVTKYACDRQTDVQNYDSQDRASIAASRGTLAITFMSVSDLSYNAKASFSALNLRIRF